PQRIEFVRMLAKTGLKDIEVGAFVRPDRVPQMAGTGALFEALNHAPLTDDNDRPFRAGQAPRLWALVPNQRGLEQAVTAHVTHIAVFIAASEAFSQANTNCSVAESLRRVRTIIAAMPSTMQVRGYISCVWGCPYREPIEHARTIELASELLEMKKEGKQAITEVSLGDTIGTGTAEAVTALLDHPNLPAKENLAVHFHDTNGRALENMRAAISRKIGVIDSSVGGLGGCPYAPGASGNVATEVVLAQAEASGLATGVSRKQITTIGQWALRTLGANSVGAVASRHGA
nr:hydroxymethylglutaryl-CoA lyase [Alphaproteobacteria bacterium]